jgi:hypothetical protein
MAATEEEILEKVLESYADEFKELSDTWKQLDQKAQGTTAIAGIFLAAVFAWAREVPKSMTSVELAILAIVTFLLVCSIGCALWSMRVRTATLPPFGKVTYEMAEDCCKALTVPGAVSSFYRQLASSWDDANSSLALQANDKAHFARCAQGVLGLAAAGVSVIAILAISRGALIP